MHYEYIEALQFKVTDLGFCIAWHYQIILQQLQNHWRLSKHALGYIVEKSPACALMALPPRHAVPANEYFGWSK